MTETTPYFEDNNRKGSTHGEAIFGDKQAQFNIPSEGREQLEHADKESAKHDVAVNAMGELAAQKYVALDSYANQHGDIPQERLDKIAARMR